MMRRAWVVPLALAMLGVAVSVAGWQELRSFEREQIHHTAQAVAAGVAGGLDAKLASRIQAAHAVARLWAKDADDDRERWTREAELYARNNELISLTRIGPGRGKPWVATASGQHEPRAVAREDAEAVEAAQRRSARTGEAAVAGPFVTREGGHVLWIVVPVPYADRAAGSLVATLDLDAVVAEFFSARALGYAVAMHSGAEPLYRRGEPAARSREADFTVEVAGSHLEGSLRPTREIITRETTFLPATVLAAGLAISVSLAALARLTHLARARARSLGRANREIGREIAATRSAEAALRKLNTELEARVAERTRELRELVKELEAFNYSVSHDLRSPLGAVVNLASLIEEDYREALGQEGRNYLGRIHASADSALSLMDGLLAFSRLGREPLRRAHVDVAALVSDVVGELTASESRMDAEIEVGPLPPAYADPTMLRLVFSNLVSNALKFSRDGVLPRVEIGAFEEGGRVVYEVRDNGVGFAPELAHKLFTPFERLHAKDRFEGSGVGLATAARVVRRHGGRIWAEGAPGEGAIFRFTLGDEDERGEADVGEG